MIHPFTLASVCQTVCAQSYFNLATFKLTASFSRSSRDAQGSLTCSSLEGVKQLCAPGHLPAIASSMLTDTLYAASALGLRESMILDEPMTKKVRRKRRDPNRPRNYMSAFNYFVMATRSKVVAANPNAKVGGSYMLTRKLSLTRLTRSA